MRKNNVTRPWAPYRPRRPLTRLCSQEKQNKVAEGVCGATVRLLGWLHDGAIRQQQRRGRSWAQRRAPQEATRTPFGKQDPMCSGEHEHSQTHADAHVCRNMFFLFFLSHWFHGSLKVTLPMERRRLGSCTHAFLFCLEELLLGLQPQNTEVCKKSTQGIQLHSHFQINLR